MENAKDIDIEKIDTSSAEFQSALKVINYTRQSVFLTGKAGTGKSTFLKYLTATTKKKYVILAPTGIAAVNAGGQTLHSFFRLPFKPMLLDDPDVADSRRLRKRLKYSKDMVKMLKAIDLIIIDEVSMVRADILDLIDRILRVYCNHRLPFGGKQLLLVGDVFQLEPVINGDVRDILAHRYRDGMFFFNALAFEQVHLVPIELCKVFRQKDDLFIRLLDRVRIGQPLETDIQILNRLVGVLPSGKMTMTIATRRDTVDEINARELALLPGAVRTFKGKITGDFSLQSLPTDMDLELKIGAQVVFIRNDMGNIASEGTSLPRRWVNGTLGKVYDFGENDIIVEVDDGTRHAVTPEVWDNIKYTYDEEKHEVKEEVLGTFTQYPLKAAWALTIHKSQGLTFDNVCIDIGHGAFSGGQTYVALSRCRSLEGISLRSTVNVRDIFVNPAVVKFSRRFNDTALIQAALAAASADDGYARAVAAFDRGDFREAALALCEAVGIRNELGRKAVPRLISRKLSVIHSLQEQNEQLKARLNEQSRMLRQLAKEYVAMGDECLQEGWDIEAALANFDKAISLSPELSHAHISRGKALAAMQQYDEALEAFRHAAALDPTDRHALVEGGKLATATGDIADALDLLLRAVELAPDVPEVHEALADAYEKSGDESSALLHRTQARRLRSRKKK